MSIAEAIALSATMLAAALIFGPVLTVLAIRMILNDRYEAKFLMSRETSDERRVTSDD